MVAWRLEHFAEIDSTSNYCSACAQRGDPAGLAVLADIQTAGRGSRGRDWVSTPGNMHLSVLLRPEYEISSLNRFPLLTGLAVAQALTQLGAAAIAPVLKWPNDVLLGGAKVAGILIDASPSHGRIEWLVMGIGVNLAFAPQIPGRFTTCLAEHGVRVAPLVAAQAVLGSLSAWLESFDVQGAAFIQDAWLKAAHPVGTEISVRGSDTTTHGRFAGLSPTGALQLHVENRIETFQTGEILLGDQGG
ncbi:MAG TPA: biotin--[acetyl-CoA-carboxylase] ligase [Acidocella sp.]|nr:biotin--[acetyl-CoA-carboxylase] ligase [Acidocella sp.]